MKKIRWNPDTVHVEAMKYKNHTDFRKFAVGAYSYAKRNSIYEIVTNHMKQNHVITRQTTINRMEQHNTIAEFKSLSPAAYKYAAENDMLKLGDWLPDVTWTNDLVLLEAYKYESRSDFKLHSPMAYQFAVKYNILDKICSHMRSYTKWTDKLVSQEALKYKNRTDFRIRSIGAYYYAVRNDLLDEVCSHMKVHKLWDYQSVNELILGYATLKVFKREQSGAWSWIVRNNFVVELTNHLLS